MLLATILATSVSLSHGEITCDDLIGSQPLKPIDISLDNVKFVDWPELVCRKFLPEYEDISFKSIGSYNSLRSHASEHQMGTLRIGEISAGRVKLTWQANKGRDRNTLWLRIKASKSVWVFRKTMGPEQEIQKKHVRMETVNVANVEGLHKLALENPIGKSTRKMVRQGQPVTENLISAPPLVKKNQEIAVVASNMKIKITTKGIALETAWDVGEKIHIRVNGATHSILGTVSGENIAYVQI